MFDKDGNKIGEATADENGKATITPTVAIPAGNVTAKATDPAGNTSDASDPMVATTDTTAPAKPVVNPVKAGDTAVTGTAEAGSTVEVTLPDGTKVSAIADQDGNFSVPVSGLKEGDQVSVTATDNAGNKSPETDITVASGAPSVTEVVDLSNLTEAEKEKVSEEVRKVNRSAREIKVSDDGTAIVTFPDGSSVTYTPAQTIKKADTTAPAKPVVNTDLTGKAGTKTPVEVSAEPGSKVELFDKDGNKIGEATADENGKATITPTVAIPAGNVTAKATDPAGNVSDASDPMVATTDTTAPAKPVVDTDLTGKAGTKTPVEVSAEPGSKVELFDKDGNKIGEATADENGKATITPTVAIPAGNVTAKATDPAGNTSDASDPMVATTDTT
ncbi:Ig-like domain-containing protein, partial [Streptococcus salivarius]|uniref:Ig-like domain-containing protein n=1 Tax=Streptococcus salivarius TaxID=1304 RepID=UPI001F4D690F